MNIFILMEARHFFFTSQTQMIFQRNLFSLDIMPISISLTWKWKAKRPLNLGKDNSHAFQQDTDQVNNIDSITFLGLKVGRCLLFLCM